MKNITLVLFVLGILVEAIAFFIGYADHVPFLFRIISPTYYRANKGLEKLRDVKSLMPPDKGFIEISQLFKNVAAKQNPSKIVERINPTEFIRKGAMQAFTADHVKEVIKVDVKLSNGQIVSWDLNEISLMVQALKLTNTFKWALIIFSLGVIIQLVGFLLGKKSGI
jgi:hypothetical protein